MGKKKLLLLAHLVQIGIRKLAVVWKGTQGASLLKYLLLVGRGKAW